MPSKRQQKAVPGVIVLVSTVLQYNSLDPFDSLDIDMPYDSYQHFQHCKSCPLRPKSSLIVTRHLVS